MRKALSNSRSKPATVAPVPTVAPAAKGVLKYSTAKLSTAKPPAVKTGIGKSATVQPKKVTPKYTTRESEQYRDFMEGSEGDEDTLITGTTTSNPIMAPQTSLIVHQGSDPFGVDIESSVPQYGSINCVSESGTDRYLSAIGPWTPLKVYVLIATLLLLVVMTLALYLTGHMDLLTLIWGKIFCWLGTTSCETDGAQLLGNQKVVYH